MSHCSKLITTLREFIVLLNTLAPISADMSLASVIKHRETMRTIADGLKKMDIVMWKMYDPRCLDSIVYKENYREIIKLEGHTDWVLSVQALPDGRIVSGSDDGTVRIWDGDEVTG